MGVPVGLLGESLVNAVVEVLVVREDDMSANIVELFSQSDLIHVLSMLSMLSIALATYEALRGDVGRGKTTGSLVAVDNQPRGLVELVQTLCGSKTSWASTNDEDIDLAVETLSVKRLQIAEYGKHLHLLSGHFDFCWW